MIALGVLQVGASSPRTMIEAAILEALEPLSVRQGGYLVKIDRYNGEIKAGASDDEIFEALGGSVPALLLQTGSATYALESVKRSRTRTRLEVDVMIASGHLRSHEARNIGDEASVHDASSDPGIYQIMADVAALLKSRPLGVAGVGTLRLRTEENAKQTSALTAWVMRFDLDYREDMLPSSSGVAVTEIEARSNLEDSAAVNPVATGKVEANG